VTVKNTTSVAIEEIPTCLPMSSNYA